MGALKIVGLIFAGLVGVLATEAGVVAWLTYAPPSLDLTGNYYTTTLLPVVVLVAVLAALVLWKIFAANPLQNCLIFGSVYIAAEAFALDQLSNPLSVVATYVALIGAVCAVVFFLFARLIWSRGAT